jgi:hypothetical protein
MAKFAEKPTSTELGTTRDVLADLVNQGFIKSPLPSMNMTSFLNELAQEYDKLRKSNPTGDKFQLLKDAIGNTQATTSNVLLNKNDSPEVSVTLLSEAGGVFGKRSINKYLEKLA